jgi:predicted permease
MSIDFAIVTHALGSVLTFFIIGCIGYFLAKRGWFTESSNRLISKLLMQVALPVYLLYNINSILSKDDLAHLAKGILPPFISILATLAIALALARVAGIRPSRRGAFLTSCCFSNTMYIGLPVNVALFGEVALPYVLLYYFANCSQFWSIGNYLLASDNLSGPRTRFFSLDTVSKVFSLPMIGFLIGLAMLFIGVKLPPFLANTARLLGGMTTPLVLISIGVTLHDMGWERIRFDKDLVLICLCRFVVAPLLMVGLIRVFGLSDMMAKVFIIQASLPVMSSIPMLASFYGTDVEFATVSASSTTFFSLVTIPVYMVLVTSLF